MLEDVSFAIETESMIGILGPNGSGKTTLLRTLMGLIPYQGHLTLADKAVSAWARKAMAGQIAWIQQRPQLAFDFTVAEFAALGLIPHANWMGKLPASYNERMGDILAAMELTDLQNRPVTALSGGEQQRLLLAQALIQDAPILLFDEPTSHLDAYYAFDLIARMKALNAAKKTILTVFHDINLAARNCDALLVLQAGKLVAAGPPEKVLTPQLIAQVFRMEATISKDEQDAIQIQFLKTIAS